VFHKTDVKTFPDLTKTISDGATYFICWLIYLSTKYLSRASQIPRTKGRLNFVS